MISAAVIFETGALLVLILTDAGLSPINKKLLFNVFALSPLMRSDANTFVPMICEVNMAITVAVSGREVMAEIAALVGAKTVSFPLPETAGAKP